MKASLQMSKVSVPCIQNQHRFPNFTCTSIGDNILEEESVTLHKVCMICCYNGLNKISAGLPLIMDNRYN